MSRITFRGKTYYSEFEMPPNIRRAYQKEQIRKTSSKPLTDIVDMSPEVKDAYKRALQQEEQANLPSVQDLPTTDELYRQSAPEELRHLPSDETIHQPSAPVIDPDHPTIEPDSGPVARGLAIGVLCALVIILIVFLIIQFLR